MRDEVQGTSAIATMRELIAAAGSRSWGQAVIQTAVSSGQRKLPFMPWYVEKFLGSSWIQQLSDRQFRGYVTLLQRMWDSETPGFLPNRPDTLWRAAGYGTHEAFTEDWPILKERIETTADGLFICNRKTLQCYAEQLPKYLGKSERGRRGADARWSARSRDARSNGASIASANGTSNTNHNHKNNIASADAVGLKRKRPLLDRIRQERLQ